MHPRRRTRKAHENQTGEHRQPKHTHHDLEHGDQVPIEGFRINVAVANGRQRFHTKEKSIEKRRHRGDTMWVQSVQPSKPKVDEEIDAENKSSEPRPAQGQNQMVGISPIELLGIELSKFELS